MTFTTFDIALPITMAAAFGIVRYIAWRKAAPGDAARLAAGDALRAVAGMGVLTVVMKYFNWI